MKLENTVLKELGNEALGGKIFENETFKEFASDFSQEEKEQCTSLEFFNDTLVLCDLKPLTKENYPNTDISFEAVQELLNEYGEQ